MQSLKGHLLIATTRLTTPIFAQTVVLMLDHNEDGAIGVILNVPIKTMVTDLSGKIFEEDFVWSKPLHLGGPVPGALTILHTIEDLADQEVIPGVFVSLEAQAVQQIIRQRPEPSLVIANYAGWGPGQLEGEFECDSWMTLPAEIEHVFWTGEADIWKAVVSQVNSRKLFEILGMKPLPVDPSVN
jgi:putative transcriptional regulator